MARKIGDRLNFLDRIKEICTVLVGLKDHRRITELGLLFVGAIVVIFAVLLAGISINGKGPPDALVVIAGIFVFILLISLLHRRLVRYADAVLFPVVLVLNGIGCVMIWCLDPGSIHQELKWTLIGFAAYGATLRLLRHPRDLERFRYLMLAGAIVLLVSPLAPVIGYSPNNAYGARLWIYLHGIEIEPVEYAKIMLVLFFSSYLVEKKEMLTLRTNRVGNFLIIDPRILGPLVLGGLAALMIIIAERNVGFALLLAMIFLVLIWIATGRPMTIVLGFVFFALAAYLGSQILPQVHERIANWLNPFGQYNLPGQPGYQPVQAELAFGRGGLFGSGLGMGVVQNPQALPVDTSDYIFAAIGEELGLFGTTAIIVGYLLIAACGVRSALHARSEFLRLAAVGLTLTLVVEAFVVIAGVVGLLPETGLTLPFISYGGSALVADYIVVAFLMRLSDNGNHPLTSLIQ